MSQNKNPNQKENLPTKPQPLQATRGMFDILPKDEEIWRFIWQTGMSVSDIHDFHYIETPILEPASLFERGVGELTDIVEKEMYIFTTKGGDRVALRPEGTTPIVRSYLEHHLGYAMSPLRVFYYEPMFRYERPQAGRYRMHHQWGFEILGEADSVYDCEIIIALHGFLKALGLKKTVLKINTIGCRVCRPNYREKLKNFYANRKSSICENCKNRLERNPLRLLDCKESGCAEIRKEAPIMLDYLCKNCNNHFRSVLELIETSGIVYELDSYLVRGLDYYSRTVFEFFAPPNNIAIGGGGRYDYLAEMLAGRPVPGIGGGLGIERVIEALKSQNVSFHLKAKPRVFFAIVGDEAKRSSLKLMNELRSSGIHVAEALGKKSLKAQLKTANRMKCQFALIFGQKEAYEKTIIVRDMMSGAQENVPLEKLVEEVKKRMK